MFEQDIEEIFKKNMFWDFDGVIKETTQLKTEAFVGLFNDISPATRSKIQRHHNLNNGISRFDKIPLYLEWAGIVKRRKQ